MQRVVFASQAVDPFAAELRERVAGHFSAGAISSKANATVIVKTVILLAVTFGCYGLILSGLCSPPVMLLLAVVMGLGVAGIGFGISHDALHGAYSSRPWVNRALGCTFELLGASSYKWRITHNVAHHVYTNIHGADEDLAVSDLVRFSPHAKWRPYHRFQHVYAFFLYGLCTLNWAFFADYQYFSRRAPEHFRKRRPSMRSILWLIATKAFYYGYTIVIPLAVLRVAWWQFAIGYLAMHFTAGLVVAVVFQLAHVVEGTEHPEPSVAGQMRQPWARHELATTANFACHDRLLSWYLSGLNFQIEHHLFPKICSVHYPALSPVLRAVVLKHGLPYNEFPTLYAALASHYRALKLLGRQGSSETKNAASRAA
jgi:linoleoyl-CoA desaturase